MTDLGVVLASVLATAGLLLWVVGVLVALTDAARSRRPAARTIRMIGWGFGIATIGVGAAIVGFGFASVGVVAFVLAAPSVAVGVAVLWGTSRLARADDA